MALGGDERPAAARGTSSLGESDKVYWHRYIDFYEKHFEKLRHVDRVLEFGVFHGDSIRYLVERFPDADVVGCDILPSQPTWPRSSRIDYVTLDQGDQNALDRLFLAYPEGFDLVIEDGSHQPDHQKNCLVATLPHVRDGGLYVLEDLHTSHPSYPGMSRTGRSRTNCYHLLLAFEHLCAVGAPLADEVLEDLTRKSLFTPDEVRDLFRRTETVEVYRRGALPLRCYRCGSATFLYSRLTCTCGAELAAVADSISAVVRVRDPA